jgi:flagella basal body P-ring formation protein FlgA
MRWSADGRRPTRVWGVAATLTLIAATVLAAGERVTVMREATVAGQTIRLGDVAALEGERAQALAALELGNAPQAGESRMLDGMAVLQALRREAGDLRSLTYSIPPTVRVRRAVQEVTEPAVRAIVEAFLAETLGPAAHDTVLRSVEVPGRIRLPAGAYVARVTPPAGAPLLGRVRLQLAFTVDDRPAKSVWVTADVGLFGPVVVARRPIARGETLAAGDLALDRRDLSQEPRGVLGGIEDAAGRMARTPLVPYVPLRREQLETPATVHRGDVVLLVAERGALRITSPGEVRDDAAVGEQVRVVNRASRKDLVGRVVDASTVAVDF